MIFDKDKQSFDRVESLDASTTEHVSYLHYTHTEVIFDKDKQSFDCVESLDACTTEHVSYLHYTHTEVIFDKDKQSFDLGCSPSTVLRPWMRTCELSASHTLLSSSSLL